MEVQMPDKAIQDLKQLSNDLIPELTIEEFKQAVDFFNSVLERLEQSTLDRLED